MKRKGSNESIHSLVGENYAMRIFRYIVAVALIVQPLVASSWDAYESPSDFTNWMKAQEGVQPQFIDGDVVTYDKAELLRPFVPPAYQDFMFYEGMEVAIKDAGDLSPAPMYKVATEKFKGQASIDADGGVVNYTAGKPFDRTQFKAGSTEDGHKLAWNFQYRWQFEGAEVGENEWVWVVPGESHQNHEIMKGHKAQYYLGKGKFERVLTGRYKRVLMTGRVDLADQGYQLEGRWAKGAEYRDYQGFTAPFDITGTAFLIQRYNDPHRTDDSWAYIPSLRRVRRISVEVKADSLLGTDLTLEDFYCFHGRILEHEWEYMGTAKLLAVARSRYRESVFGGDMGIVPIDDWALRTMDVVKVTPKWKGHPYSYKVMMLDLDTNQCYYAEAYDKAGKTWKVLQASKIWTEDEHFHDGSSNDDTTLKIPETPRGVRVSGFQSIQAIDRQNNRGTIIPVRGVTYPVNKYSDIKRRLDVNYLTEGR
jgi:hypothetical protein